MKQAKMTQWKSNNDNMKKDQFVLPYLVYDNEDEMPAMDAALLCKAHEAALNAYAPYSKFMVGAAVRLANGEIVTGSNIENAAYPSGLCAERVAMFSAQSQYPNVPIESIAVTAHSNNTIIYEPVQPCGACRQVMVEVEKLSGKPLKIFCQGEVGPVMAFEGIETILPFIFSGKYL
jgi:cytidine deaminase, homotetrameric